jgi:hypothetical protein
VVDCSRKGLGLLITKKDFDLLSGLKVGDTITNMVFFAKWTMITVNGTVKHLTKLDQGRYSGCYSLGIESQEIIESCKPHE